MRKKFTDCVDIVGSSCENFEGTKFYISTGAVDEDNINEYGIEVINFEEKPSRANLVVKSDDIIFAKMQATKKTLLINEEFAEYVYSTGFCAVHAKKNILTRDCLLYLLMSEAFLNQKDKNCSGATQKAITNAGLQKIIVNIPDYKMQDDISKKLSILLKVINMRQNELDMLEDLIKARFVEMFGDPVANEMGWNTLPLENACKAIVDCPHSTPSYTKEDTGFMCIRTSIVKKNRIIWDDIEYIPEDEFLKRIQRKKPDVGDIVYTREGAILGIAAIIDRDCNVALGQRSMLLSPNTDKCTSEFLCVAMNRDSFLDNALKGVSGSASPHINVGDIKAFRMIMPPIELQEQFADFFHQVNKSKVVYMYILKTRKYLMYNGKYREK